MGTRKTGFLLELHIVRLLVGKERNDRVNSCPPPAFNLILQPIAAAGASRHGELSGKRRFYPIELGIQGVALILLNLFSHDYFPR